MGSVINNLFYLFADFLLVDFLRSTQNPFANFIKDGILFVDELLVEFENLNVFQVIKMEPKTTADNHLGTIYDCLMI